MLDAIKEEPVIAVIVITIAAIIILGLASQMLGDGNIQAYEMGNSVTCYTFHNNIDCLQVDK